MAHHRWFVFMASFITYGLTGGLYYSFGALFPVIMETFNSSRTEASVIQSVFWGILLGGEPHKIDLTLEQIASTDAVYRLTGITALNQSVYARKEWMITRTVRGILYGALTSRLGTSRATLLGTSLSSLGFIVSFWSTSLSYLIATIVVIAFGSGICLVTCFVSVRHHFADQAGVVALAFVSSSSGVSGTVLTYLLEYLSKSYGLRGTFLIIGGIQLNCVVLSVLLKAPPNKHTRKLNKRKYMKLTVSASATDDLQQHSCNETSKLLGDCSKETQPLYVNNKYTNGAISRKGRGSYESNIDRKDEYPVDDDDALLLSHCGSETDKIRKKSIKPSPTSSETSENTLPSSKPCDKLRMSTFTKVKHIVLLPSYIFTSLGVATSLTVIQVYPVFTVDIYVDGGFSESQGSIGLIIMNIAAMFGRVSPAALAHCPLYDPFFLPIVACLLSAIAMILHLFVTDITLYFILSGVIGVNVGVTASALLVNVSEIIEQHYLAEAIGLLGSIVGASSMAVGPLTGFIRDTVGSYDIAHITAASFTVLGSLMFILASYFLRIQRRTQPCVS